MEGKGRPSVGIVGFSVLEVRDIQSVQRVRHEVEHGSGALGNADAETAAEVGGVAERLGDESELEEVDIGTA